MQKEKGLLSLIFLTVIGLGFLNKFNITSESEYLALNMLTIDSIKQEKYSSRKEAQNLINYLGLKHNIIDYNVKLNFYHLHKDSITVAVEYKVPNRQFISFELPIGNTDRKTLQKYLRNN